MTVVDLARSLDRSHEKRATIFGGLGIAKHSTACDPHASLRRTSALKRLIDTLALFRRPPISP